MNEKCTRRLKVMIYRFKKIGFYLFNRLNVKFLFVESHDIQVQQVKSHEKCTHLFNRFLFAGAVLGLRWDAYTQFEHRHTESVLVLRWDVYTQCTHLEMRWSVTVCIVLGLFEHSIYCLEHRFVALNTGLLFWVCLNTGLTHDIQVCWL